MKHYKVKTNINEALRYLGNHGSSVDSNVSRQLHDAAALLDKITEPAYTYKVFDLVRLDSADAPEPLRKNPTDPSRGAPEEADAPSHEKKPAFALKGTSILLTGNSAADLLKECSSCIVMAVTIGRRVDSAMHRLQVTDMAGAVILDSCASSAVESICNQLGDDLEEEFKRRGLYLTDRFSPGYGDLPLSLQPEICRALSTEKRIGISITGGMLMMPTKSVTAIIGISDRPQPKKLTGCSRCMMRASCNYRKAGVTCAG